MLDIEGLAWSRQVLGECGPHIRAELPGVLNTTHDTLAALHAAMSLGRDDAYGLMWIKLPQALVAAFGGLAGVHLVQPRGAGYRVPVVNGVPLVPWRYAKDRVTDVENVPFGVSSARRSIFEGQHQLGLDIGASGLGEAIVGELPTEERQRLSAHIQAIRGLARRGRIAVLAYASTPDALLRAHLGYADLGPDDRLIWAFREELTLPTAELPDTTEAIPTQRHAFDSGPVGEPVLRPRARKRSAP